MSRRENCMVLRDVDLSDLKPLALSQLAEAPINNKQQQWFHVAYMVSRDVDLSGHGLRGFRMC